MNRRLTARAQEWPEWSCAPVGWSVGTEGVTEIRFSFPDPDSRSLTPIPDFRTGKLTAIIDAGVSPGIRATCHALNLRQKSGIEAAFGSAPPRGAVSN